MDPSDNQTPKPQEPIADNRQVSIPARDQQGMSIPERHAAAAANVLRDQIDNIYETAPPNQAQEQPTQSTAENPYERTHGDAMQKTDWTKYHTAWQNYYQQYYQRYYIQQLHVQRQQQSGYRAEEAAKKPAETEKVAEPFDHRKQIVVGSNPEEETRKKPSTPVDQFKNELVGKIRERAQRVRKSHHFMPIISAVIVGALFLFLQFNRVMIAEVKAYISPGSATAENIIVDPSANLTVGPDPKLIIPKINVDVPVVYGVQSLEDKPVQDALRGGVVHYPLPGANAVPGQVGNSVVLGHSSNDVFDSGAYKFAFVLLDRMQNGDVFYMNYQGKRYTYRVTDKKIISPSEFSALQITTTKPMATLVTCTPPGTALKRLIVVAEQVSPDPAGAAGPTTPPAEEKKPSTLPGYQAPTFLEQIFGFFTN